MEVRGKVEDAVEDGGCHAQIVLNCWPNNADRVTNALKGNEVIIRPADEPPKLAVPKHLLERVRGESTDVKSELNRPYAAARGRRLLLAELLPHIEAAPDEQSLADWLRQFGALSLGESHRGGDSKHWAMLQNRKTGMNIGHAWGHPTPEAALEALAELVVEKGLADEVPVLEERLERNEAWRELYEALESAWKAQNCEEVVLRSRMGGFEVIAMAEWEFDAMCRSQDIDPVAACNSLAEAAQPAQKDPDEMDFNECDDELIEANATWKILSRPDGQPWLAVYGPDFVDTQEAHATNTENARAAVRALREHLGEDGGDDDMS